MKRLKSEYYKGYKITFRQFNNGFIEGKSNNILVGAFKTKAKTLDYIKKEIDRREKIISKKNYFTLQEFQRELGV